MSDQLDYEWRCDAHPKTEVAKRISLDSGYGRSKDETRRKVEANYLYRARRMTLKAHLDEFGAPQVTRMAATQ